MDISNAKRQVAEINALKGSERYAHAIEVTTPALFQRLEKATAVTNGVGALPVKKCISIKVHCRELNIGELEDLVLHLDLPLDYPSESICRVSNVTDNRGDDIGIRDAIDEKVTTYLRSFPGCECVELILDWLSDNRSTCLHPPSNDGGIVGNSHADTAGKMECYVIRYNHLLEGPEHKKEKAMVDAAKKMKLQGGLLWGTPGIVVVVPPSTAEDAREYASDCRDIGKRPDGNGEVVYLDPSDLEKAGLGGLAQQKRGGKLQSMDTATLRSACGGDEDLLRIVLGVK